MRKKGLAPKTSELGRAYDVANVIMHVITQKTEALAFDDLIKKEAIAVVKSKGASGSDEAVLHNEWISDLLVDNEAFKLASATPGRAYIDWLQTRLMDTHYLSKRTEDKILRQFGYDVGRLFLIRWRQEISWIYRLRMHDDDTFSAASHAYLLATIRNPSKELAKMAEYFVMAATDPHYNAASYEHDLEPIQIRLGMGDPTFTPLSLRIIEKEYVPRISKSPAAQIEAMANYARTHEEAALKVVRGIHACEYLSTTFFRRMLGVIAVAVELKLSTDELFLAEMSFITKVRSGEISLSAMFGIPYSEFLLFLRGLNRRDLPDAPMSAYDSITREEEVARAFSSPKWFVAKLPNDYETLDAGEPKRVQEWLAPFLDKSRELPADLISDYGFFLIATNSNQARHSKERT